MFAHPKISSTFALEFPLERTFKVLLIAAFFVFACNATSIGCCNPSGSRYLALLSVPKQGVQQSFFIHTFLISQLERTVKNATGTNNSSAPSTPSGAKTVPTITLTLTGVRSNPYLYAIRKAFREFLIEETQGNWFAERRFVKKYEAAMFLFPEYRTALRGKKVTINH